jgi:hypothetical protein
MVLASKVSYWVCRGMWLCWMSTLRDVALLDVDSAGCRLCGLSALRVVGSAVKSALPPDVRRGYAPPLS